MTEQVEPIVFKANKEGILIFLPERIPFSDLKNSFNKKVLGSRNFFGNAKTKLIFKGRDLSEIEEKELLGLMYRYTDLDIILSEKTEKKPKLELLVPETEPIIEIGEEASQGLNVFHHGSLRSGQCIEKEGSIVLIGDVKSGSEVKVSGNVVVLGTITGLVHAGVNGDVTATVSALKFGSSQIRIAHLISHIPEGSEAKKPSHAYIDEGKIFIAPLI